MSSGPFRLFSPRPSAGLLACLVILAFPAARCLADVQHGDETDNQDNNAAAPQSDGPNLSENVSEQFEQFKPLIDAKQWDAAVALLNTMAASVADPNSYQGGYDLTVILDTKAKTLVEADRLSEAIAPWEEVLHLVQVHPSYYYKHQIADIQHYLAQIYSQLATAIKVTPGPDLEERKSLQHSEFVKAISYMQLWLKDNPTATQDDQLFYTDMVFNLASSSTGDEAQKLLKQADVEAVKGLHMSAHPHDEFYYLVAAAAEQNGDLARAADYLEILVRRLPDNKEYPPQLMSIYLNMAANPKEKRNSKDYYLRAINAIERAQTHGIMKDQRTNLDLVTIYFDLGQYGEATDLLSAGLNSGAIAPTESNWQVLAYSYQQINDNDKAIQAYLDASKIYPDDGQLDYSVGQIYAQAEDLPNAYQYFNLAAQKGHIPSTYNLYINLAYTAFEIDKLDAALAACDAAAKLPEAKGSADLPQLRSAIEDKIKEEQKAKEAIAATPQ